MSFKTIEPPQYETTVETSVDHSLFCECSSGHSLLIADMLVHQPKPFEFSLEFFEFSLNLANSVTKIFVITVKGLECATQSLV